MDALTVLAFMLPASLAAIAITRNIKNRGETSSVIAKHIKADYAEILRSKEERIEELTKSVQKYKNKASNMERGPIIEGEESELGEILPELLTKFAPNAPKWLKPLLEDNETQKFLIKRFEENPEQMLGYFKRFLGKKDQVQEQQEQQEQIESF